MKNTFRLPFITLVLLIFALLIVSTFLFAPQWPAVALAQENTTPLPDEASGPVVKQATNFGVTPALRDLDLPIEPRTSFRRGIVEQNTERREANINPPLSGETDSAETLGPATQQGLTPNTAPPLSSFEGLSNEDNATINGFRVNPPDTVGDVGRTQYVQAVNLLFSVYDKVTGTPLTAPRPISVLFDVLPANSRCRLRDDGDPIVIYDSFADRWLISQFVAPDFEPTPQNEPPFAQCFAISQTGDASGAYFVYEFTSPNNKFGDYPKYGVWPDAYYSTVNQFFPFAPGFLGVGVFAYDRAKMLRGDPTASYVFFDLETIVPNARGMLPSDADGLIPPPAGSPNVFTFFNANEFIGETDSLRLFDFHVDFANPSASTFTERPDSPLPVAAFDPLSPTLRDDIEQPRPMLPNALLDSIGDRLMHRFQYRNFNDFEGWTVNHTVNAGTRTSGFLPTPAQYRAAVRYYELRRPASGSFTVQNQATFAPDTNERWMGSAAMDNQGNLALGYSTSSVSVFPSIRYTGRLATDPPNTLQSEQVFLAGTGVQTNANSRWGDYSSLNIDPSDECTFFYTQEYYQTADRTPATPPFGVNWQTRFGSFRFAECVAPLRGTLQITVRNCQTNEALAGATITIDGNLQGTTSANGTFTTDLPPGTYSVTVSGPGFATSLATTVTITSGGTTTVDVCLNPAPTILVQSVTLISESCPPANGVIDPGETVTVDVTLRNVGAASTTNLVATLQPTGGVVSPSGPQTYGVLAPGATATRSFSLTASGECGGTITLTLQLQDGTTDLGIASFTHVLGTLDTAPVLIENFDAVTPPALPTGWTTSTTGSPPPAPTPTPPPPSPWITTSAFSDSPPNSAATTDNPYFSTSALISPVIAIPSSSGEGSNARLSFRNFFNLELSFDGGVLEISINGGPFEDIIVAGGVFESGEYRGILQGNPAEQPLLGRQAWTGNSGGFITTTVRLPANAVGQNVQFRWLMANDASVEVQNGGWRIDTITLTSSTRVCCGVNSAQRERLFVPASSASLALSQIRDELAEELTTSNLSDALLTWTPQLPTLFRARKKYQSRLGTGWQLNAIPERLTATPVLKDSRKNLYSSAPIHKAH